MATPSSAGERRFAAPASGPGPPPRRIQWRPALLPATPRTALSLRSAIVAPRSPWPRPLVADLDASHDAKPPLSAVHPAQGPKRPRQRCRRRVRDPAPGRGPAVLAATRPDSAPLPGRVKGAARPCGTACAALDPGPGGAGRRPRRPGGAGGGKAGRPRAPDAGDSAGIGEGRSWSVQWDAGTAVLRWGCRAGPARTAQGGVQRDGLWVELR